MKLDIIQMASLIISIIMLLLTIYIPKKLAWEQYYNALITEYRSMQFGKSMQNVIQFYTKNCHCDVSRIREEYEKRFKKEIENCEPISEQSLHYDRRLLAQFFLDLEKCANTRWYYIGRKRVVRDFTTGTQKLVEILFFMDKAVEESPLLFKEITINDRVPKSSRLKGMNKHLAHMNEILKESKKYME